MEHETLPSISALVNFGILATVLFVALRKPLLEGLQGRHTHWKTEVDEAEKLRLQTESLLKDTQTKIAALDQEVASIYSDARKAAEQEKAQLLAQAQVQADKIIEEAKRMAEAEKLYAMNALKRDMLKEAIENAKKELKGKIGPDDHARFIDSLVKGTQATHG